VSVGAGGFVDTAEAGWVFAFVDGLVASPIGRHGIGRSRREDWAIVANELR